MDALGQVPSRIFWVKLRFEFKVIVFKKYLIGQHTYLLSHVVFYGFFPNPQIMYKSLFNQNFKYLAVMLFSPDYDSRE